MATILDVVRYLVRFIIFFITNCYGLFGYVMWAMLLLPLRFSWPTLYWKAEAWLFRALQSLVLLWIGSGGYGVIEAGDDISKLIDEEVVLLCNHQSTADTPLVMLALWSKGAVMANSMWIMDWVFRYTNFGLVSTIRNDIFIKQGKENRELQARSLREHLKHCYLPQHRQWIVLFPEGGFLRKRLAVSHSYAKKNGYPVLHNVTLPRIGALKAVLDTVGAPVHDSANAGVANGNCDHDPERPLKWVVDMTIGYYNGEGSPPDMFGMCVGYREKQDMHVHYRAYPVSTLPRDSDGLVKWIFDRYEEKEELLGHFKIHGQFPAASSQEGRGALPSLPPRRLVYDWLSVLAIQGFYITSAYLHYTCVIQPLWALVFG